MKEQSNAPRNIFTFFAIMGLGSLLVIGFKIPRQTVGLSFVMAGVILFLYTYLGDKEKRPSKKDSMKENKKHPYKKRRKEK